jgi:hypothetical protein
MAKGNPWAARNNLHRRLVGIDQPAGGLRPRGPSRRRGEVAADCAEILLSGRCRDAGRQRSGSGSGPPRRPITTWRRCAWPGTLVIRQHPACLGLHSASVKHATFSDVADTRVQRLDDTPRCGAVALLVHRANPNRASMWSVTLPRPGLGCIAGVLRFQRYGINQPPAQPGHVWPPCSTECRAATSVCAAGGGVAARSPGDPRRWRSKLPALEKSAVGVEGEIASASWNGC